VRFVRTSDQTGGNLLFQFLSLLLAAGLPAPRKSLKNLAAINGWVADVLSLHDVNHIFGNVRRVVADAFQILGHQNQLEKPGRPRWNPPIM